MCPFLENSAYIVSPGLDYKHRLFFTCLIAFILEPYVKRDAGLILSLSVLKGKGK